MADSLEQELDELRDAHRNLLGQLDELAAADAAKRLTILNSLLARQRAIGESTKELRNRIQCDFDAVTERRTVEDLLASAPDVNGDPDSREAALVRNTPLLRAIALALLRGNFEAARNGLKRVGAPFETLTKSLVGTVDALIDRKTVSIKHLESAMYRLHNGEERLSLTRSIRGALLVQLGRLYREELQSRHMASGAFRDAVGLLRQHPEAHVEHAEQLRRAGRLDAAAEIFQSCTKNSPQRAGAWIGLALINEARGAWEEASANAGRAGSIVGLDKDPLAVLERIQPSPCSSVFRELGRIVRDMNPGLAARAYEKAIAIRIKQRGTVDALLPTLYVERAELTSPPHSESLCEAGRLLCWRGQYREAIDHLERAVVAGTRSRPLFAYLADTYRLHAAQQSGPDRTRSLERGLGAATLAMEFGPLRRGDAWILITRARIIQALVDDEVLGDDDLWEALAHCEHALVLEPRNSAILARAARFHHAVGNPLTARHCAETAVSVTPQDPEVVNVWVWVLSVSGEFERAQALLPRIPDGVWRRMADAYLRIRMRESRASLEIARGLLVEPATDKLMRSYQPVVSGLCLLLLGDIDAARAQFEVAQASSRILDRMESALYLERFDQVVALGESQRHRLRYHTDENFIAALTLAHVALGNIEQAEVHFRRLCAFLRGPIAGNWAITFEQDVALLPAFRQLSGPSREAYLRMIDRLHQLAAEREHRSSPATRELESSLQEQNTPTEREALQLACLRTAVVDGRIGALVDPKDRLIEVLRVLPDNARCNEAKSLAAAITLARASADRSPEMVDAALKLGPAIERVPDYLETSGQVAFLLSCAPALWSEAPLISWVGRHLGLQAPNPKFGLTPITLAIPARLAASPGSEVQLLNAVIPDVRRRLEATYGAVIPAVHIRRLKGAMECRLLIRGGRIATATDMSESKLTDWMFDQLANHLAGLVSPNEVVTKIDEAAEQLSIDRDGRLLSDTGSLLRLWRLARGLLKEHVPLHPWSRAATAARNSRGLPFEAMLNHARRYMNDALCAELTRRAQSQPVLDIPRGLAEKVLYRVGLDENRSYFAAPPDEIADFLTLMETGIKALGVGKTPIFRVSEPEARPWIQQIVNIQRPSAMVVSDEEYQRFSNRFVGDT